MSQDSTDPIRELVIQRLESLQRAGVQTWRRGKASTIASSSTPSNLMEDPKVAPAPATPAPSSTAGDVAVVAEEPSRSVAKDSLEVLQKEVAGCTLCAELAETRTQTVFGVGDPSAKLCFFGEAPGADEDRQGEPFVGRAGRLLTDMIEKGMGLKRSDVYILNVLKCRPPGNRNPNTEEVANCRPFFQRQLELIAPEYICCLGSVAAQSLLNTKQSVGKMRGSFHQYRDIEVVVTYHPAYLLRNPSAKKETWKDLKLLMQAMGLPVPKSSEPKS